MKLKAYVGIDPGYREAGIGVVNADTGLFLDCVRLFEWTPLKANEALRFINKEFDVIISAIEKVGVMKGQGISSSGKFMKATGTLIGLLVGNDMPFIEVTPQKWKTVHPDLICSKCSSTEKKNKSLEYARIRFPEARLTQKIHHNIADSLGIADWLYMTYNRRST